MSGITHNAYRVAVRLEAMGPAVQREVGAALDVQAQLLARVMRQKAPKFQSALVDSIQVTAPQPFVREISPGVRHGVFQERGIKPGGKGLPRFFDPASVSVVAWLQAKLGGLPRGARKRQSFELALRDRYEGLAHHIRAKGMRATPFVKPTFDEQRSNVSAALHLAIRKGMAMDGAA